MFRKSFSISVLLLALCMAIASCGTSKNSTRKCDHRKGTKTPMGWM